MPRIALSNDQLHIIIASAEPLDQADRGAFLEFLAELLAEVGVNDVAVARAARLAHCGRAELRRAFPRGSPGAAKGMGRLTATNVSKNCHRDCHRTR